MKNVYDKFVIPNTIPLTETQFEYKNTKYSLNTNIGFDYKDYKINKMTPKEEADKLLDIFLNVVNKYDCHGYEHGIALDCAITSVNEKISLMIKFHGRQIEDNYYQIEHYQKVKIELEKL